MITHLVNRSTQERMSIELEIGNHWWLKGGDGEIRKVERSQFPPATWRQLGQDLPSDAFGFGQAFNPA